MQKDKPSRTAYKVALCIVTLGEKSGMAKVLPPGIVEATAKLLVASGVVGSRAIKWSQSKRMISVYEAFDWMLPGQFEALGHRKAFCEYQVRECINQGASQILILGAGYDTLGWRLAPEFPQVTFFEIDHPATARLKIKGIETLGRRDNQVFIAEDLGNRRLEDILKATERWDLNATTIVLAEGLVMYLTHAAVLDLFKQCAITTGPNSRVAFSYIPCGKDARLDAGRWTGLMLWLQNAFGEPWTWCIRPDELESFLSEAGWHSLQSQPWTDQKYGAEFYVVAAK